MILLQTVQNTLDFSLAPLGSVFRNTFSVCGSETPGSSHQGHAKLLDKDSKHIKNTLTFPTSSLKSWVARRGDKNQGSSRTPSIRSRYTSFSHVPHPEVRAMQYANRALFGPMSRRESASPGSALRSPLSSGATPTARTPIPPGAGLDRFGMGGA